MLFGDIHLAHAFGARTDLTGISVRRKSEPERELIIRVDSDVSAQNVVLPFTDIIGLPWHFRRINAFVTRLIRHLCDNVTVGNKRNGILAGNIQCVYGNIRRSEFIFFPFRYVAVLFRYLRLLQFVVFYGKSQRSDRHSVRNESRHVFDRHIYRVYYLISAVSLVFLPATRISCFLRNSRLFNLVSFRTVLNRNYLSVRYKSNFVI